MLNGFGERASLVAEEGLSHSCLYPHFLSPKYLFWGIFHKQNSTLSTSPKWNFNFLISLRRKLKIHSWLTEANGYRLCLKLITQSGTFQLCRTSHVANVHFWGYQIRKLKSVEITESDFSLYKQFPPEMS